ncbi:PREDICTED: uncharacterized protein LOC104743036 isoform X2 [Camelina sativa]|uniref:Uncharacterized protein LOC104743036 isoform X2 n=1 Tax=Camelina sativa TaxID=90675 RepID=A0ABM0VXD0_CAMSA|nr:PREDICTED: uncharacterized protein LOC104743036 isoform X2 [Camelina sativa]
MANETSTCVFITTNKHTHFGILLNGDDSVSVFKEKISMEHQQCFPSFGKISVSALKVDLGGQFYHLSDSIILSQAIQGIRNDDWYLFVDVEVNGEMLPITAPCSNPDPNLITKVTEEKTKKRKLKISASDKKSQKKPALGDATSGKGVVEAIGIDVVKDLTNVTAPALEAMDGVHENPKDLGKEVTNLLSEAIGKACPTSNLEASSSAGLEKSSKDQIDLSLVAQNEGLKDGIVATSESVPSSSGGKITNTLVLLADPRAKEIGAKDIGEKDADEASKSVKATKKIMTKKAKAPAKEETEGSSSAPKVEPGVVVSDPQENVGKVEKKSSKKSKKKPSSNVVEES